MKCILYLLWSLFIYQHASCQRDSVLVEVRVTAIKYGGEQIKFPQPVVITISQVDTTPIVRLGVVGGKEIGMRMELLETKIGLTSPYVLGKAFFSMKPEGWKLGSAVEYKPISPKVISIKAGEKDEKDFEYCGSSFSSMKKSESFEISYMERRYIFR